MFEDLFAYPKVVARRRDEEQGGEDFVFHGWEDDAPFGSFPRQWTKLLAKTDLAGITPHVLRHSFASIGNDLGFTEATIAALVGHSRGTITSRYIHTVDTALIMAADSIAGYIQVCWTALRSPTPPTRSIVTLESWHSLTS